MTNPCDGIDSEQQIDLRGSGAAHRDAQNILAFIRQTPAEPGPMEPVLVGYKRRCRDGTCYLTPMYKVIENDLEDSDTEENHGVGGRTLSEIQVRGTL